MRTRQGAADEIPHGRNFAPPPWALPSEPRTLRVRALVDEPAPAPPSRPRRQETGRLGRVLGWAGRAAITAGVLVLLFMAYQLWGTGLASSRAQGRLEDDFAARLRAAESAEPATPGPPAPGGPPSSVAAPAVPAAGVVSAQGEVGGRLEIAEIGVDWMFVEGVGVEDLQQGPGHFPGTPFPGQAGNASLAGHRTTYGAPFHRIDELEPGDEIAVTTLQGRFTYTVTDQQIVRPDQVEVLRDVGDDRLTLVACHPKYSARQRIIVVAHLTGTPAPTTPATVTGSTSSRTPVSLDAGASDETADALPVVAWGLVPAGIWLAAWLVGRSWRRWPAYLVALPLFFASLFVFYEHLSRLLPPSI